MVRSSASCRARDDSERAYALEHGHDLNQVLTTRDLVDSDNTIFAATGVTSGSLLNGIGFYGRSVETHSVVMRSQSGTIRFIEGTHRLDWVDAINPAN